MPLGKAADCIMGQCFTMCCFWLFCIELLCHTSLEQNPARETDAKRNLCCSVKRPTKSSTPFLFVLKALKQKENLLGSMILNQLCGSTSLEAEKHGLGMVGVVRDRTIPLHLSAIWKRM